LTRRPYSRLLCVPLALAAVGSAAGCRDDREYRESVEFHVVSVRQCIQRLRHVVNTPPRPVDNPDRPANKGYALKIAADGLRRALMHLPGRIKTSATTRVPERLAAAEKAKQAFAAIHPTLEGLPPEKVNATLDEIAALMDEIQK